MVPKTNALSIRPQNHLRNHSHYMSSEHKQSQRPRLLMELFVCPRAPVYVVRPMRLRPRHWISNVITDVLGLGPAHGQAAIANGHSALMSVHAASAANRLSTP